MGNILSKDFRILGLDDRKGRWVGVFRSMLHVFLPFSPVSLIE